MHAHLQFMFKLTKINTMTAISPQDISDFSGFNIYRHCLCVKFPMGLPLDLRWLHSARGSTNIYSVFQAVPKSKYLKFVGKVKKHYPLIIDN